MLIPAVTLTKDFKEISTESLLTRGGSGHEFRLIL